MKRGKTMRYLVCQKQYGEGCDYTIGCGMLFDFIDADSVHDAIEKTVYPGGRGKGEYCSLEGEQALEEIFVIPEEHVIIVDVASMTEEIKKQREYEAEEEQKEKELAELKRLQEKYNKEKS